MRELHNDDLNTVGGGIALLAAIEIGVAVYEAANILYEFGKGVSDGMKD